MSGIEAISAIGIGLDPVVATNPDLNAAAARPDISASVTVTGFGEMLAQGLETVENKINTANAIVQDFAVDDSVPIHQVTLALEEARLAVELAMQVRTRLVEGYREIMNMQL